MRSQSPKQQFLNKSELDEVESQDSLIELQPSEYVPGPTGARVHASLARTKILRGGLGSGKSRCGTEHGNALALAYPGSFGFVGRKDITMLKVTTQKEYLEKVVRPETIASFNVNENKLYYKNGSLVLFGDTKFPSDFKSFELTWYDIDEADENESSELWTVLDDRLRQKIWIDGKLVIPPYSGMWVFNPTDEDHWLYDLAHRTDVDVEDFQFSTYENEKNLPPDYIPNLLRKLPPWEVDRLIHGNWGRKITGKPVLHGFTQETHVRALKFVEHWPLYRAWDFGYNHPAIGWYQICPRCSRKMKLREYMGSKKKLHDVMPEMIRINNELANPFHPTIDWGDPHGADEKDVGETSIDYLKTHHRIFVQHKRQRIKTGLDDIQEAILTRRKCEDCCPDVEAPMFLVDHSCKISISAYLGGYHRGDDGMPVKDGYYDHVVDTDRYFSVGTSGVLINHRHQKRRYIPRNPYTGY